MDNTEGSAQPVSCIPSQLNNQITQDKDPLLTNLEEVSTNTNINGSNSDLSDSANASKPLKTSHKLGADVTPTMINATADLAQPFEINEEDPETPIDEVKFSELKAKADTEPYWNF